MSSTGQPSFIDYPPAHEEPSSIADIQQMRDVRTFAPQTTICLSWRLQQLESPSGPLHLPDTVLVITPLSLPPHQLNGTHHTSVTSLARSQSASFSRLLDVTTARVLLHRTNAILGPTAIDIATHDPHQPVQPWVATHIDQVVKNLAMTVKERMAIKCKNHHEMIPRGSVITTTKYRELTHLSQDPGMMTYCHAFTPVSRPNRASQRLLMEAMDLAATVQPRGRPTKLRVCWQQSKKQGDGINMLEFTGVQPRMFPSDVPGDQGQLGQVFQDGSFTGVDATNTYFAQGGSQRAAGAEAGYGYNATEGWRAPSRGFNMGPTYQQSFAEWDELPDGWAPDPRGASATYSTAEIYAEPAEVSTRQMADMGDELMRVYEHPSPWPAWWEGIDTSYIGAQGGSLQCFSVAGAQQPLNHDSIGWDSRNQAHEGNHTSSEQVDVSHGIESEFFHRG